VTLDSFFEENSINPVIHTAIWCGKNGDEGFEIFQIIVYKFNGIVTLCDKQ
jgi:hypothetical protein